jgi:ribosome-associated protein
MSDEEISKSARKRDARRQQTLGEQLADLNDAQRASLPLPDVLVKALADYRKITAHEAKRRQGQFIGRLMRKIDVTEIENALDGLSRNNAAARFAHHKTERWRALLIADDAALTTYLQAHPGTDRTRLRALIRTTRARRDDPTAFRALFRFLRDNHQPEDDAGHDGAAELVPPTVT